MEFLIEALKGTDDNHKIWCLVYELEYHSKNYDDDIHALAEQMILKLALKDYEKAVKNNGE